QARLAAVTRITPHHRTRFVIPRTLRSNGRARQLSPPPAKWKSDRKCFLIIKSHATLVGTTSTVIRTDLRPVCLSLGGQNRESPALFGIARNLLKSLNSR